LQTLKNEVKNHNFSKKKKKIVPPMYSHCKNHISLIELYHKNYVKKLIYIYKEIFKKFVSIEIYRI